MYLLGENYTASCIQDIKDIVEFIGNEVLIQMIEQYSVA
jgi:hypothetical protein